MSTIQINLTNAAFNNERELIKKVTHDLSDVVGMTLVEVSYGIDGLGMKFAHLTKMARGEHELDFCWCGSHHVTGDDSSKPIGPPLKDMREGDIPKMPKDTPYERPTTRRAPAHDSMGPEK